MNFSFALVLVSLRFRFVLCEKCSETLHETFKRYFDVRGKCNDCIILSPGISSRGRLWAGYCTGNKLVLIQDWKCKAASDLLNLTETYAVVYNNICELFRKNHNLDETCLKMFNNEICNRGSKKQNEIDGNTKFFLPTEEPKEIRAETFLFLNGQKNISLPFFLEKRSKGTSSTKTIRKSISTGMTTTGSTFEETFIETMSMEKTTTQTSTSSTIGKSTSGVTTSEQSTTNFTDSIATKTAGTETEEDTSSSTEEKIMSSRSAEPQVSWPPSPVKKTCEINEFFFNDHCYFIKLHSERVRFNSTKICQTWHPKGLGLAVETKAENRFILGVLKEFHFYKRFTIFTAGIRKMGFPDEWMGWNLKINGSVLNFKDSTFSSDEMFYCIDACDGNWYLWSPKLTDSTAFESIVICERPYNPKNIQLELHERCLELYRKSSCYNFINHSKYCCAKDETGEIWFSCPNQTHRRVYPKYATCWWRCGENGFFIQDRPNCIGTNVCLDYYKNIRYIAPITRYAVSNCPENRSGHSTWYCSQNNTFLGRPDYSLCCEDIFQCRDTDVFLNFWMGCPSKKIVKKTACPQGSVLAEALVEWYCQANGTFFGNIPNYSNCNVHEKIACRKKDRFGTEWRAAAGTTAKANCPPNFTGQCYWECKQSGEFEGFEPDCTSCRAAWMEEIADKIKIQADHDEVMTMMENYTKKEDIRIGYDHVLNLTFDCVALFKNQIHKNNRNVFNNFLRRYSNILKNVAGNIDLWSSFTVTKTKGFTEKILKTTQSAAFANLLFENSTSQKYNETLARSKADGFDFFVTYKPSVGSRFPLENFAESDWHLDIKEMNESNPSFAAMGLVMNYSLSLLMFPQGNSSEDLKINGPAITFTVAASNNGEIITDPNVVISIWFRHKSRTRLPGIKVIKRRLHEGEQPSGVFNSTLCFYYRDLNWNTKGCSVIFTTKDQTNCTCTHLSTIGLLMSIHKYERDWTLELLSTVSSGITIFSLILTLIVFCFFDTAGNERVFIGKNLCFCLLGGHTMLITVLDKKFFNIPDGICTVYAVVLHYVFMAAFSWMFVEGCHLYRMLILVFDSDIEYRFIYLLIGYGMPFVIVGATHLVGFIFKEQPYGQDELCWLNPPNYVWAFVGPVIVLTSINFCILITALKLAISSKRKTEKSNLASLKLWMKGCMSLSALLGITWLFGLAYINYNETMVYVFVFFNGLQGFFIFLFRCVLCEQYRTVFLKKIKSFFSKSTSNSHKKVENIKLETKLYAVSASKSLTETKDSGYDPEIHVVEDCKKRLRTNIKSGYKPDENSSRVDFNADITLTPATSIAYLRNKMIARNFSARESKAKWLADSDNFPELSFHNFYHP